MSERQHLEDVEQSPWKDLETSGDRWEIVGLSTEPDPLCPVSTAEVVSVLLESQRP